MPDSYINNKDVLQNIIDTFKLRVKNKKFSHTFYIYGYCILCIQFDIYIRDCKKNWKYFSFSKMYQP